MRHNALRSALVLVVLSLPTAARATPIDDFKLTGDGHTITYSLPATSSFPDFSLFSFFQESAIATVDGIVVGTESGDYYDPSFFPGLSLVLGVPHTVSASGQLLLEGPSFIDFSFVPAVNPYPYLPYDVVPTFIPGTYTLQSLTAPSTPVFPAVSYTLTITPETPTTVTPEPSTIALLATGLLGLLGLAAVRPPSPAPPGRLPAPPTL